MADSTISLLLDAEKEAQRVVETARRGMSLNAPNKHKHINANTNASIYASINASIEAGIYATVLVAYEGVPNTV